MKLIAFYLPQFHEIPENNKWWGKGFTEWVTVQNARSLYTGHQQPKEPYKDDYYNLLDRKVMKRQSLYAQKSGIDAFCMYHYWFKGKKILEKPAENYLKWKDIPTEFCFSWANESWTRTWTIPDGNNWYSENFGENLSDMKDKYLLKQDYGTKEDWNNHFQYLLPFFKDSRYVRKDNKPIFLIYKPDSIPCLLPMMQYFQKLAKENGLEGIYFILTNTSKNYGNYGDGYVMYEPIHSIRKDLPLFYKWRDRLIDEHKIDTKGLKKYNYDIMWLKIILRKRKREGTNYHGVFTGYDESPRRSDRGIILTRSNPFKFFVYLTILLLRLKKSDSDMVFITAWNEWSEGAYLEPDKKNGFRYLNAVKKARQISKC